jgi:hypothetical protein
VLAKETLVSEPRTPIIRAFDAISRQRRSLSLLISSVVIGVLLAPILALGVLPTPWAGADGGDFSIDFVAAGPFTYNHATGVGGQYNGRLISKTQGVNESLEGGDFNCGDRIVYFAAVEVDENAVGSQDIEIDFQFDSEPTGQGTVGIDDVELVGLNAGDSGNLGLDGDEVGTLLSEALVTTGQDHVDATVGITNLDAGERFILRMVTVLTCPTNTDPTGNIQSRVAAARVVSPVADAISVGAQVVPMMSLADVFTGGITIIKDAVPNSEQDFAFTATGDDVANFILDDDGTDLNPLSSSQVFPGLDDGVRTITETPVVGWTLSNIACTGATTSIVTVGAAGGFDPGDTAVTIDINDDENVTCTFTNTQQGSITIVKDAVPDDLQDFAFTTVGAGVQNFDLDDDGINVNTLSNTRAFSGLVPGARTITETPVVGWTLSSIICTGATTSVVTIGAAGGFDPGDTAVTINLAPGENVNCTFTNTRQPSSITIVKDAVPNDAQDFAFTTAGAGLQSFDLDDDGNNANTLSNTEAFSGLAPGVRTVTETPAAGWTLSNIICTGATNSTVTIGAVGGFNAGDTSVTINLAPGEDVSCTFTNTRQPSSITIVKDAVPNDAQDFAFTTVGDGIQNVSLDDDGNNANTLANTASFGGLVPGVRTVTETPVAGWTLSNIVCTGATNSIVTIGAAGGFNAGDTAVTINLAPGENVTCTFTNTKNPPPPYGGNDPGDVDPGDPYGQDPVDPNVVNPYVPAPPAPTTTTPVDTNAGVAGDTNPLNPVSDQPQVLGGEAERPAPDTGGGLLPRTGAGLLGEGLLALLLVGAGLVMMRIGRRRRTQTSA